MSATPMVPKCAWCGDNVLPPHMPYSEATPADLARLAATMKMDGSKVPEVCQHQLRLKGY